MEKPKYPIFYSLNMHLDLTNKTFLFKKKHTPYLWTELKNHLIIYEPN